MNIDLTNAASLCTIILAIAAIIGGILAYININILREQHRRNTFLSLISNLSSESARKNREIINFCMTPDTNGHYLTEIPVNTIWSLMPLGIGEQIGMAGVTNAIEETVNCLDKVGFFLLRGDPKLKKEAPLGVWTITNEMWGKLSNYVNNRQRSNYAWGKYFKELYDEGIKQSRYSFESKTGSGLI